MNKNTCKKWNHIHSCPSLTNHPNSWNLFSFSNSIKVNFSYQNSLRTSINSLNMLISSLNKQIVRLMWNSKRGRDWKELYKWYWGNWKSIMTGRCRLKRRIKPKLVEKQKGPRLIDPKLIIEATLSNTRWDKNSVVIIKILVWYFFRIIWTSVYFLFASMIIKRNTQLIDAIIWVNINELVNSI